VQVFDHVVIVASIVGTALSAAQNPTCGLLIASTNDSAVTITPVGKQYTGIEVWQRLHLFLSSNPR
jgi:hypothetical protein